MNFSDTSDFTVEPVRQITNYVNNNQMLTYVVSLLLILYAVVASPSIPDKLANLIKNPLFKLSIIAVIGYVAMNDPVTAVVITMIALVISQRMLGTKTLLLKDDKAKNDIKTEAIVKAKEHTAAAEEARKVGNVEEVKAHLQEAAKQEAKVEAIVKAEAHVAAAEEAKKVGNVEKFQAELQEAAKQEAKVEALVKAEAHVAAAEEANKRGNVEEVKAHLQEAAKQEAKVEALVKAEAHVAAAEEANNSGDVEEASEQDVDVGTIVSNNENNNIPCGVVDDTHAPYILQPVDPIKTVLPEVNINAETNVSGYDYVDYATF